MVAGQIARSGGKDLAIELEENGYAGLGQQENADRLPVGSTR
jgi:Fe-S cluster assembly ATPase SufC